MRRPKEWPTTPRSTGPIEEAEISFLFGDGQSAAAPPPPPSMASPSVALAQGDARMAAAAAAGKGFGRTIKTSAKGAPTPDTADLGLSPVAATKSAFGG